MIFQSSSRHNPIELSTVIKREIEYNLQPDDIILIVRDSEFEGLTSLLAQSAQFDQSLRRLRGRSNLSIIGFDHLGREARRSMIGGLPASEVGLSDVQRPCTTDIFNRHNGFVEATPGFHFENPSGKHTDKFIRLANILHDSAEISFIAFCTLPYIAHDCDTILVDTPPVLTIAGAVNEHLQKLQPGREFIQAYNFGSYAGLENLDIGLNAKITILISATTSENLAKKISNDLKVNSEQIVHILFLSKEDPQFSPICDLSFDQSKNREGFKDVPLDFRDGACALCDGGSTCIPIYGDQFDLAPPQLDAVTLLRSDATEELRTTIGKYAGSGIYGVGLGRRDESQPRLFNISVERLLDHEEFRRDMAYVLDQAVPASLSYVIYLDRRSKPIAESALQRFDGSAEKPEVIRRDELDKISDSVSKPILVVAAAIESGRSLLDISRDLRTKCRDVPLSYVIGFEKTTGERRRQELTSNLIMSTNPAQHRVAILDTLVLPISGEGGAWTTEQEFWAKWLPEISDQEAMEKFVTARLDQLSDRSTTIEDDLFLPNGEGARLEIQPGFVFANEGKVDRYSQADVFFTIASILQRLRSQSEKNSNFRAIRSNWFQQTLLSPSNFARFNDGVVQASFLRAANPGELNYEGREDLSKEMTRIVCRIIESADQSRGEAAAEFLLAIASERLKLTSSDRRLIQSVTPASSPIVDSLHKICRHR